MSDGCGEICEERFLLSRKDQFGTEAKRIAGLGPHAQCRCVPLQPAADDALNSIAPDENRKDRPAAPFAATERRGSRKPAPSGRGRGLVGATDLAAFV